jgi:hypothetical protein
MHRLAITVSGCRRHGQAIVGRGQWRPLDAVRPIAVGLHPRLQNGPAGRHIVDDGVDRQRWIIGDVPNNSPFRKFTDSLYAVRNTIKPETAGFKLLLEFEEPAK